MSVNTSERYEVAVIGAGVIVTNSDENLQLEREAVERRSHARLEGPREEHAEDILRATASDSGIGGAAAMA